MLKATSLMNFETLTCTIVAYRKEKCIAVTLSGLKKEDNKDTMKWRRRYKKKWKPTFLSTHTRVLE